MRWISAILIAGSGIMLFTWLLCAGFVGEAAYTTLIGIAVVISFAVYAIDRLKELDLRQMRVTLQEIEDIRDDVYAKHDDLRDAVERLIELIAFENAWTMRIGEDEDYELRRRWVEKKGREVLNAFKTAESAKSNAFKYHEELRKLDACDESDCVQQHKQIISMLRQDLER